MQVSWHQRYFQEIMDNKEFAGAEAVVQNRAGERIHLNSEEESMIWRVEELDGTFKKKVQQNCVTERLRIESSAKGRLTGLERWLSTWGWDN